VRPQKTHAFEQAASALAPAADVPAPRATLFDQAGESLDSPSRHLEPTERLLELLLPFPPAVEAAA
jgi:hypothetical protein